MSVIKKLKPILFPVRVEAATSDNGYSFNPDLNHQVIVFPTEHEDGIVVNACSKGYTLVDNNQLFLPLAQKLEKKYPKVDVVVKHYRFSKFYVDFVIKDFYIKISEGDYLYPRLRVINTYDGSVTYRFTMGFFRPFCLNMINSNSDVLPLDEEDLEDFDNITMRHTESVKDAIEKSIKMVERFIELAPKIKTVYKSMSKTVYKNAEERLIEVAEDTKYPPKSIEYAIAQLHREKDKFPVTDYIIYNCLNFGLYSNPKSQMKDHKKDKIDIRVLNYLLNK